MIEELYEKILAKRSTAVMYQARLSAFSDDESVRVCSTYAGKIAAYSTILEMIRDNTKIFYQQIKNDE